MTNELKDLLQNIIKTNLGSEDICSYTVSDYHEAGIMRRLASNGYINILNQAGNDYSLKITPEGMLFLNK